MIDKIEINHCTTCGQPTYYEVTMYLGLQKFHTKNRGFLCPEPEKPDLSPTKKRAK